jgi:predicted dehydrogenase
MATKISRRDFLKTGALGVAGLSIMPGKVFGSALGHTAPSDIVNVAGIGVGGRGGAVLRELGSKAKIVGIADVDWKYANGTFNTYPDAKKFYDYRKLFDEMKGDIDAVVVGTADHTHAIIASDAMTLGKHVYCEKPLTHSVYESRLLTKLAAKTGVATQMGNQGSSGEGVNLVCDWIWNGEIGEVTRVEAFTDRPIWPQGLARPTAVDAIPDTFDWELFIGPAAMRPFNHIYCPWNWRGWWDFGTGALGDMACHILHPVFKGLKLGYPTRVQGSSTSLLTDSCPSAQTVELVFPDRGSYENVKLPEVTVKWFDGGLLPTRPEGLPDGRNLNNNGGGVIFYGTKDTLICGCYGLDPWLLSGRVPNAPKRTRRVGMGHGEDWIRACKENKKNRVLTASDFSEAGPFNEMVVMGVLAVRLQTLNKILQWDGENMRFTNIGDGDELRIMIEDGFSIKDGHPTFNKTWTDPINAQEFASGLIKHNYREGWKLVDMPK